MSLHTSDDFYAAVRAVPDFPQPGVVFRDITPLLADPRLFRQAAESMASPFRDSDITKVIAIESRGFIFGGPIAVDLSAGLVPIRKEGKLPRATRRVDYSLEYGHATLEAHEDAVRAGERVLIVDDVLATGGTARATCELVEGSGGVVVGLAFLIEIEPLGGRARVAPRRVEAVMAY